MNHSEDYEEDLTKYIESLQPELQISTFLCVCLAFMNICLLLTSLSKRNRGISAIWYIYCLLGGIIFYGFIVCIGLTSPAFYATTGCVVLHSIYRLLQLLYGVCVIWINIEVYRTIISVKVAWMRLKFRRFCYAMGISFLVSLVAVIAVGVYSFRYGCWSRNSLLAEIVIHILKNWVPGLIVIIMMILNIIGYVKLRSRGLETYNQFVENSSVAIYPTEWFVCVVLIDSIFIVFEILFVHLMIFFLVHEDLVFIRFLERLVIMILGLPILALSSVRHTIAAFFRRTFNRPGEARPDTVDMNMDAIEDDSL